MPPCRMHWKECDIDCIRWKWAIHEFLALSTAQRAITIAVEISRASALWMHRWLYVEFPRPAHIQLLTLDSHHFFCMDTHKQNVRTSAEIVLSVPIHNVPIDSSIVICLEFFYACVCYKNVVVCSCVIYSKSLQSKVRVWINDQNIGTLRLAQRSSAAAPDSHLCATFNGWVCSF